MRACGLTSILPQSRATKAPCYPGVLPGPLLRHKVFKTGPKDQSPPVAFPCHRDREHQPPSSEEEMFSQVLAAHARACINMSLLSNGSKMRLTSYCCSEVAVARAESTEPEDIPDDQCFRRPRLTSLPSALLLWLQAQRTRLTPSV